MNWDLVRTAPPEVFAHVEEEWERMQTLAGALERGLELAIRAHVSRLGAAWRSAGARRADDGLARLLRLAGHDRLPLGAVRCGAVLSALVDTWTCHVCGATRPDAKISVHTTDVSDEHGLPAGTFHQNVRYCNDRPSCVEGAKKHRFFKPVKAAVRRMRKDQRQRWLNRS